MAEHLRTPREEDDEVTIYITPTIERDYRRRNVFEELWSQRADKTQPNGTFVHTACSDFAEDVLEDAQDQRTNSDGPRGTRASYTALARQIEAQLRLLLRRHTLPDPGYGAMLNTPPPSPARFRVGDAAVVWSPGDDSHHLQLVEIVSEYRLRIVASESGRYLNKDGVRVDYYHAYSAKSPGDEVYAWAPHQLRDPDQRIRHLRLVR